LSATVLPFRAMDQMPNRIRELRKARGWRLEDLADKAGCGITYVHDLEQGKRELSYHWMKRFARAFKVQPADLLNDADNSKSLSAPERELVDLYDRADDAQREQLLQMARILVGPAVKTARRAANS
jgi:transcriptional regulator with XRE-family HTH domain